MSRTFSDARSVDQAEVYKNGILAALLVRTGAGVELRYRSDYLAAAGQPLCATLPLSPDPYLSTSGAVPSFFAGLLPEGRRLTALRLAVKTSADDEFSLLLAVGSNPIGDVFVLPQGAEPQDTDPLLNIQTPIESVRFSDLLDRVGIVDPVALPGVQDKASVAGLSLPIGHRDDQFILKIDPPEHPNIVLNEAYFLQLATNAGLPTTKFAQVTDLDGRPGLLVQRFDRQSSSGAQLRLECEDACQLLGRWPADKYNVTAELAAEALIGRCDAGIVAARDVLRQLVFAWLTGNGDVHAKNLSVLRNDAGERRIAPAYDLPSTIPYGDLTMALSIGGKASGISRRQWIDFGSRLGVREAATSKLIEHLLAATERVSEDLMSGALPFNETVVRGWTKELRNRRNLLKAH